MPELLCNGAIRRHYSYINVKRGKSNGKNYYARLLRTHGQVISQIVKEDADAQIVAGIDPFDNGKMEYPVYKSLEDCKEEADVVIDFASAKAEDALLDYCGAHKLPVVVCTTGLSEEQLQKVAETAKKTAVLKSANMSLGINTLLNLLKSAAKVLAEAGFDNGNR